MTIAFSSSMAPRTAGSKDSILPPTLLRSLSNSPSKPATSSGIAHEYGGTTSSPSGPSSTFNASTSPENTLIVFDWDDTFFPTSALERNRLLRIPAQKLRPQLVQQLNYLAQLVMDCLTLAEQYGKVVIITNSAPGWIDASCQAFMPMMHAKIRSYPIFAKPMNYLLTYKLDVFKREMIQGRYQNLVSVGDGIAERTATLRLVGTQPSSTHRFCKSVKLKEMPTIQQLVDQLELYMKRAEHLAKYTGDLDLRTNFGITAASRLGRLQQSPGGCSFVHLSHLAPASERDDQMLLGPYLQHQTQNRSRVGLPHTGQHHFNSSSGATGAIERSSITGSSSAQWSDQHDDHQNSNSAPHQTTAMSSNSHHVVGDGSILPRLISSSADILDAPEPVRAISKTGAGRGGSVGGSHNFANNRQQLATSGDKLLRANKVIMPRTQRPGAFTPPIGIGMGRR
mmetsp:Transcript_3451/g.8113  ORF Transcript_3451/g.8113 Transcript_3451/m.8113 type:complete len:453 (-) Transcript_3451:889-2247(-)